MSALLLGGWGVQTLVMSTTFVFYAYSNTYERKLKFLFPLRREPFMQLGEELKLQMCGEMAFFKRG